MQQMHAYLTRFDHAVAAAIKLLPAWLSPLMKAATFIGEPVVTVGVGVMMGAAAIITDMPALVVAEVGAAIAFGGNTILKHIVRRARPDTLFVHHMKIKSYSFPSGHAFGSTVFYGLPAYLTFVHWPHPWNICALVVLTVLIFLIGVSRVYLQAHFPSDVTIGWLLGGLCLLLIIGFVRP